MSIAGFEAFRYNVRQRFIESHISLKPDHPFGILNLFNTKIDFKSSPAVLQRVASTGYINSNANLTFWDCPQLGDISTKEDVILIGCPNHGKIKARNIHCYYSSDDKLVGKKIYIYSDDSRDTITLKNGGIDSIVTAYKTIKLVNFTVQKSIVFQNEYGPFQGTIIVDKNSRIKALEAVQGKILYLKA